MNSSALVMAAIERSSHSLLVAPHASALPGCATRRNSDYSRGPIGSIEKTPYFKQFLTQQLQPAGVIPSQVAGPRIFRFGFIQ